ncbi:MAG TPA: metallothionein [Gammaproteobacteria bacterium]|nr:metallothionein [Gammaproteobacteria bacterium]
MGQGSEAVTQARCAHPPCQCLVSVAAAVVSGGRFYCVAGCAQGRGCQHEHCACATLAHDTGAPGL